MDIIWACIYIIAACISTLNVSQLNIFMNVSFIQQNIVANLKFSATALHNLILMSRFYSQILI